ncbi:hypothetical protein FACS189472_09290 [Alphaproteobacteria bacterium]|nr:hypothetical protein FACS189472_09290 [Alphaproteobacteria bacterium]
MLKSNIVRSACCTIALVCGGVSGMNGDVVGTDTNVINIEFKVDGYVVDNISFPNSPTRDKTACCSIVSNGDSVRIYMIRDQKAHYKREF